MSIVDISYVVALITSIYCVFAGTCTKIHSSGLFFKLIKYNNFAESKVINYRTAE